MKRAALILLALAALIPLRAGASGATFVAASANPGASFATAADFNTVSVALTDPGTNLRGTVSLSATAASDRGIAAVTFQTTAAGGSGWTDACTVSVAPYTCSFDTTTVADGLRDIRVVATDSAGYSRTASVTGRRFDNIAPSTSLTDPGAVLTGTKTLSATAADAGSGLASIKLQYRAGATWTDICAATSCSLNTATLPDGLYDLRSLATDNAGNTNTSVVSARRVDNTAPTASLSSLPGYVRGTISLAAAVGDGNGAGITSVKYQMRVNGTSAWSDACTAATAPFACSGDTSAVPDGLYDVRAVATDGAGFTTTSAAVTTRVDNAAPATATLTNPGTPLQNTVTLNATATDAGSGIASLQFQSAPAGTTNWTTVCTSSGASCAWDTTGTTDALYDLRVIATDKAGNTLASATVASRRVDNDGPALDFTDPGARVRSPLTLSATASDPAGLTSVTFQYKLSAAGSWTTCAVDTSSPYACTISTLTNGQSYDFRATALDAVGHSTTATYASRVADTTAPRGTGVQAINGGGTAGMIDAGDKVTFTYSEAMDPDSILAGWDGSAVAVTVRVTNNSSNDRLTVYNAADSSRLSLTTSSGVQLKANRVSGTAKWAATMTMSGTNVVVTLGASTAGTTTAPSGTTPMVWSPSSAATDLAGNACSTATVTESGTDVDF